MNQPMHRLIHWLTHFPTAPSTRHGGLLLVGGGSITALAGPEEAEAALRCRATIGGQCWSEAEERELHNLVNGYRVQHGRWALKLNRKPGIAAERHSQFQVRTGESDHTEAPGSKFYALPGRLRAVKYIGRPTAETTAMYSRDGSANRIFRGWQRSLGHNELLLYPRFNEVRVARARGAGGWYWTAVFARSQ